MNLRLLAARSSRAIFAGPCHGLATGRGRPGNRADPRTSPFLFSAADRDLAQEPSAEHARAAVEHLGVRAAMRPWHEPLRDQSRPADRLSSSGREGPLAALCSLAVASCGIFARARRPPDLARHALRPTVVRSSCAGSCSAMPLAERRCPRRPSLSRAVRTRWRAAIRARAALCSHLRRMASTPALFELADPFAHTPGSQARRARMPDRKIP